MPPKTEEGAGRDGGRGGRERRRKRGQGETEEEGTERDGGRGGRRRKRGDRERRQKRGQGETEEEGTERETEEHIIEYHMDLSRWPPIGRPSTTSLLTRVRG